MKLDWRRGIVYLAIMGVEGCPLYALVTLLNLQVAGGQLAVFPLLLTYPAAFAFNLLLKYLKWPRIATYPINILAGVAVTLLMVKTQLYGDLALTDPAWLLAVPQAMANILYAFASPLLLLLLSALAWWVGWHLADLRASFTTALSEFQFTLAVMLVVFFIAAELGVSMDNVVALALAFFVFALVAMSVAHAREDTGWLSGLRGHWPGLLLVSIGLVLVLGLTITALVTPDLLNLVITAIAWVFDQLMRLIAFLVSLLPSPGPMEPIPGLNQTGAEPKEGPLLSIPEPVLSGLRLGWTIIFCGLIVLALWRVSSQIFAWMRQRMANMAGAEVESMPGAFRADILGFLKRILYKLLGLRLVRRPVKTESREIASVRQLYRHVLDWAAGYGWRRPAFQTPYEYLPTLEKLLPACAQDFRSITRGYVNARYGLSAPSAEELARLKQSWRQINHYGLTRRQGEAEQ